MRLNQVTVPSLNLEKSILFYQKLGLIIIVKALPNYARFLCPDGNATFSIHLQNKLPLEKGPIIYFEEDNLDEFVENLVAEGLIFDELPNDKTWLWREAHLTDPDGNHIVLFKAGINRINPPWRINV